MPESHQLLDRIISWKLIKVLTLQANRQHRCRAGMPESRVHESNTSESLSISISDFPSTVLHRTVLLYSAVDPRCAVLYCTVSCSQRHHSRACCGGNRTFKCFHCPTECPADSQPRLVHGESRGAGTPVKCSHESPFRLSKSHHASTWVHVVLTLQQGGTLGRFSARRF